MTILGVPNILSVSSNKFLTLFLSEESQLKSSAPISSFKEFSLSVFLAARPIFIPLAWNILAKDVLNPGPEPTINRDF